MSQHWPDPEPGPLPPRFIRRAQKQIDDNVEVRIQTGAGSYEDKFRYYWLVAAWVFLSYQALAMLIILWRMALPDTSYVWLPHLVGTSIIALAMGTTAVIYRYVLFPPPGYYSRSPHDVAALAAAYVGAHASSHPKSNPVDGVAA